MKCRVMRNDLHFSLGDIEHSCILVWTLVCVDESREEEICDGSEGSKRALGGDSDSLVRTGPKDKSLSALAHDRYRIGGLSTGQASFRVVECIRPPPLA